MGLSGAVEWWHEWQLRILVLGSLAAQYILAFFGPLRKFSINPCCRLFIWLSYLSSDALAIYALATLFNRQKVPEHSSLEVLWAPILLMHLGGHFNVTAYNIEDNELWRRHFVTAASQVIVALFVFCKSWTSSNRIISAVTIMLFVPAIIKCYEKPLALKRASFNSLVSFSNPAARTTTTDREQELDDYIRQARTLVHENDPPPTLDSHDRKSHLNRLAKTDKLFVDLTHPYSDRLANIKSFWVLDDVTSYSSLNEGLSNIFDRLYTRSIRTRNVDTMKRFCCSTWMLQVLMAALASVAMSLFAMYFNSKDAKFDNRDDIFFTFVLLSATYILELATPMINIQWLRWNDLVSQHSLIGFFVRNKRRTWLMSIAECLQCKNMIDQYWCIQPRYSSEDITVLVRRYVKDWWKNFIVDGDSYRRFNDINGQWTLEHNGCDDQLGWSLEKPFDESILLWHVATDFCFHQKSTFPDPECVNRCREISNYMVHLLYANPEMLMTGSRRNLFTTACDELETILGKDEPAVDERGLAQKIIDKVKSKEGFIHDAWVLAEGLMDLEGEKMWEVIRGVWVEMLCFSASRCRGYLHAKSLGSGGEFLSYIWLLLSYAGMETLPERLQRRQRHSARKERMTQCDSETGVQNAAGSSSQYTNPTSTESPPQVEGTASDPEIEIVVSP
ncbi:hypothetical protein ACP70R_002914 [Stipagrostis hirtigluma subsp. patula]